MRLEHGQVTLLLLRRSSGRPQQAPALARLLFKLPHPLEEACLLSHPRREALSTLHRFHLEPVELSPASLTRGYFGDRGCCHPSPLVEIGWGGAQRRRLLAPSAGDAAADLARQSRMPGQD